MFTAQSRVHAVSEYIDNRRGSIGPEARTRLAEAGRQIEAAQDKKATDLSEAITHANSAASLAAQAQSLAEADVQSAQRAYTSRYGSGDHTGAMMGGIIIGDMLGGRRLRWRWVRRRLGPDVVRWLRLIRRRIHGRRRPVLMARRPPKWWTRQLTTP